jgi:hypothetical protein
LAQDRGAHDAWLYGDVQVRLLEDGRWVFVQNLAEGHEFGVTSSLEASMLDDDCIECKVA